MTKRRKAYQEKRKATSDREMRAMDAVIRGLDPNIACKHFAIFDKRVKAALKQWYIPKEESWLDKARKRIGIQMFNDIADDYNSKNK